MEGMKIQKLKSPKIQNMLQSNRAASDGAKGHRIGNRLGKFSPNAVEGLYMYPVCTDIIPGFPPEFFFIIINHLEQV